jgi:hypothetical protein
MVRPSSGRERFALLSRSVGFVKLRALHFPLQGNGQGAPHRRIAPEDSQEFLPVNLSQCLAPSASTACCNPAGACHMMRCSLNCGVGSSQCVSHDACNVAVTPCPRIAFMARMALLAGQRMRGTAPESRRRALKNLKKAPVIISVASSQLCVVSSARLAVSPSLWHRSSFAKSRA